MPFNFISPASKDLDFYLKKYDFTDKPKPYCSKTVLTEHLQNALFWGTIEFDLRKHTNTGAGEINCVCYYSDDPDYPMAECTESNGTYFIHLDMSLVRHFVVVCHYLKEVLDKRPRTGIRLAEEIYHSIEADPALYQSLKMEGEVSDDLVKQIVSNWPSAFTEYGQVDLGDWSVFYDLLRTIWVHEWAHAVCGHMQFVDKKLGLMAYPEHSAERLSEEKKASLSHPTNEVLQVLEMHADEFSIRYNFDELLYGREPVTVIGGPRIDLTDRILILDTAFCIFCIWSEIVEHRYFPDVTFEPSDSSGKEIFAPYPISHPPAALRYLRFRDFQREFALNYDPRLQITVDSVSFSMLRLLGAACKWFNRLLPITPLLTKTPVMKQLIAYETYLLNVGEEVFPYLDQYNFKPTMLPKRE